MIQRPASVALKPMGTVPDAVQGQAIKVLKPTSEMPVLDLNHAGDAVVETECRIARTERGAETMNTTEQAAGATTTTLKPRGDVSAIAAELQALQRQRAVILKSRNMQANRLQAVIAGTLGYSSSMPEKERRKKFDEATALINRIKAGEQSHSFARIVLATLEGIKAFNGLKASLEKEMVKLAGKLPVAAWVKAPEQRGFGLLFLAIVIGETGDLANYANPAKVWKRLGCAPHTFDGKTKMGATWKSGKEGKLPALEWEQFGYSPRRRSIAYLIGEGLQKQNFVKPDGAGETTNEPEARFIAPGPYRARYDQAKATFQATHPDYKPLRCHLHGMLLAAKLLLKNLWIEWNDRPAMERV